jgi:formylglycine-generating enzyme required for sulfatase activity
LSYHLHFYFLLFTSPPKGDAHLKGAGEVPALEVHYETNFTNRTVHAFHDEKRIMLNLKLRLLLNGTLALALFSSSALSQDLTVAEKDAKDVGDKLKSIGFDVTPCLGPEASQEKLRESLNRFLAKLKKVNTNDIVLIMFSGHGQELSTTVIKPDGNKQTEQFPYFCAYNSIGFDEKKHVLRDKSEQQIEDEFHLVSLNRVLGNLDESSNSVYNLLVVDACRSNPGKGKVSGISGERAELRSGMSAFFASRSGQKSYESEDERIKNGVFTHFLLEGLNGEAENKDGELTWGRLVDHVTNQVETKGPALAGDPSRKQTPELLNKTQGSIVLSIRKQPIEKPLVAPFSKSDAAMAQQPTAKPLVAPFSKSDAALAQSQWSVALGIPVNSRSPVGIEMVLIPPGKFTMGAPASEKESDSRERPTHSVTISKPFLVSKYEVTQSFFEKIMGFNPSVFSASGGSRHKSAGQSTDKFPVENVSWFDAVAFCNGLSTAEGLSPYYQISKIEKHDNGNSIKSATVLVIDGSEGYRLLTEAEWEYAARAGTTTPFHFGNINDGSKANVRGMDPYGRQGKGISIGRTTKVGTYGANAFGMHDFCGNVEEWCYDVFDPKVYDGLTHATDPLVKSGSEYHVLRGGSWGTHVSNGGSRSASRNWLTPDFRDSIFGFRLSRTP